MAAIFKSKKVWRNVLKIKKGIYTVKDVLSRFLGRIGSSLSAMWRRLRLPDNGYPEVRKIFPIKFLYLLKESLKLNWLFQHFSQVKSISVRSTSRPTAKYCHMFYYETNIWHFPGKNVMKWVFCFQDDSDWSYSDLSVQLNNYISQWKQHTNCYASTGNFFSFKKEFSSSSKATCHPKANIFSAGRPSRFPADPSVNSYWSVCGGGNRRDQKVFHGDVMRTFVSILVFKNFTPVQAYNRFSFLLLFLLLKFSNSAIIKRNINV